MMVAWIVNNPVPPKNKIPSEIDPYINEMNDAWTDAAIVCAIVKSGRLGFRL